MNLNVGNGNNMIGNKERSKSSNGVLSTSSSSQQQQQHQQPPHMIAEFPDYYVRNDDIIRPKPRRLVDMRRSAVGPGIELSFASSVPVNTPVQRMPINPPILPARSLNSSQLLKPLPPKPSTNSTNNKNSTHQFMLSPTNVNKPLQQQLPIINSDNYLQCSQFLNNTSANLMKGPNNRHLSPIITNQQQFQGNRRNETNNTPQSFTSSHLIHSSSTTSSNGCGGINLSQRSVPSLPHLLQNERQSLSPPVHYQQQHQQQRSFLSPQPTSQDNRNNYPNNNRLPYNKGHNSGSTSNLSHGASNPNINNHSRSAINEYYTNNTDNNMPYYSDLVSSNSNNNSSSQYQRLIIQPSQPNVVRGVVEWKSVDNLQLVQHHQLQIANNKSSNSNNTPTSSRVSIIDYGEPASQDACEEKEKVQMPPINSSVVRNLSLAFELNSSSSRDTNGSKGTANNYEVPKQSYLVVPRRKSGESSSNDNDDLSPLYDRIRSPFSQVVDHQEAELIRYDNTKGLSNNKNVLLSNPTLSPLSSLSNRPSPHPNTSSTATNSPSTKISESTDESSLGRSSTSDYDFSSSHGSTSTVKTAVLQPSIELHNNNPSNQINNNDGRTLLSPSNMRQKSKQNNSAVAPSSKLKSKSRRNILQHLSMDEIQELKNGTNNILSTTVNNINNSISTNPTTTMTAEKTANNTGTGGSSSSDGSSGHASMSDSQTSGSPPAPAEYGKINNNKTGESVLSPYKSVLKSVPEDEQQQSSIVLNKSINSNSSSSTNNSRLQKNDNNNIFMSRKSSSGGGNSSNSSGGGGGHRKSSSKRHRSNNKDSILLGNGNNGLEDIKQAIEQLTLKSSITNSTTTILEKNQLLSNGNRFLGNTTTGGDHHSSYSTSTYSSMSGSECERHRRPTNHHNNNSNNSNNLIRHSSLETINTQVTSADEFVWVDSHNRLVELQQFPWSNVDILKVIEKSSKLRENLERISMETVPRVSYLLQRALVRLARETQRLSKTIGFCSKHEVTSAFRIALAPGLADSCVKACLRAAAMYSVSTSDPLHRQSKSGRAGLHLHVGRFQRWMCDLRIGRFVHEIAAIHFTAGMENLIEEIFSQSLAFISSSDTIENHFNNINGISSNGSNGQQQQKVLTAALLEQAISFNGDLWGLLQPFAHLNAGRMASGALAIPRWSSIISVDSSGSSTTIGGTHDDLSHRLHQHNKSLEQSLLTTCVGSIVELSDILIKVISYHHKKIPLTNTSGGKSFPPSWSPHATHTLFYFMRCSQLESADELANLNASTATLRSDNVDKSNHNLQNRLPVQELVYERPFIVLPPLIEWVRVATAHADHRHSGLIDNDDVLQAARLLLPGIDCPVRLVGCDEFAWPKRPIDEFECNRRLKIDLAFKILTSERSDLVGQALLLMPPSKSNTFNESGLSPLILASIRGEEVKVKVLLDAGADVDLETPPNGQKYPQANSETQSWTALTFAALMGHATILKILLERGANVEGGAKLSEEKPTQTPLQVAVATGNLEIVNALLNYGANPFHSTLVRDSVCYMGSAQRGSFSAISVATSHGQRTILHKLLSHPLNSTQAAKEVLSLEEILAEGIQHQQQQQSSTATDSSTKQLLQYGRSIDNPTNNKVLTKSQMKVLQESMYQSAENGYLEITLDLRNLGVPWTLHCWINTLETAHDLRCETIVDQLLQDFLQILPNEDFSQTHFVDECLPLLLTIFRNGKNEGTTLLLADIFQTCYGKDPIKDINDTCISNTAGTRIDPKYVNNPELSDVQFRVEGKIFYAHKIVLVTSSPRFKSMLKGVPEANPPLLQINDIRYPIFKIVMEYLYNGGCDTIKCSIENDDILELMAAANFFQLDGLLRFCESKCSQMVNVESVVSLYIHAKVYNATQLLEYCQGFLLQNMVAILTYDDSVRRLIFGKKLHNHDVLAGLLLTLQDRLKCNKSNNLHNSNRKLFNSCSNKNSNNGNRQST